MKLVFVLSKFSSYPTSSYPSFTVHCSTAELRKDSMLANLLREFKEFEIVVQSLKLCSLFPLDTDWVLPAEQSLRRRAVGYGRFASHLSIV